MITNTIIATVILLCGAPKLVKGAPMRVCYYGSWSDTLHVSGIDPHLCTHLMFAFSNLDHNGVNLEPFSPNEVNMYMPFTHLKASNPHLKTILSVGGWSAGSKLFVKLAASQSHMDTFANNTIKLLRKYHFDGLDVDWEYPADRGSGPEDKAHFVTLIRTLHNAFLHEPNRGTKPRLLLSAAVGAEESRVTASYDVPALSRYLDFINLMTYDFHGEWDDKVNVHSALFSHNDFSVDRFVKYWLAQGAPKNKLVVGVAFYGRTFNLADPHKTNVGASHTGGGEISYSEICQQIKAHHIQPVVLTTERVPYYAYGGKWVGYEDVNSITEKGHYIRDHGLAGAMVWAIDLDDTTGHCGGGPFPLMHALNKALETASPAVGR